MYMNSLQAGHGSGLSAPQIYSINTMTAKSLLDRIKKIRKAIDYRQTKIDILTSQAENASARLTGMPHTPSADPSPMATAICKKVDLEHEIEYLTTERNSLIAQIDLLRKQRSFAASDPAVCAGSTVGRYRGRDGFLREAHIPTTQISR